MMNIFKILLFTLLSFNVSAASKMSHAHLKLNGSGERLATFFNIRVYTAWLYLEKLSKATPEVISQAGEKVIVMKFNRSLGKSRLVSGFQSSMKKNNLKDAFQSIYKTVEDVSSGDEMRFSFKANSLKYQFNESKIVEVKIDNASEYLKLWIGKAPNVELKTGLLGEGK